MLPLTGLSCAPNRRIADYTATWTSERDSAAVQSLPKPAFKHVRTEFQSDSDRRPIKRTSRCNSVTGNSLKNDGW